MVVVADLVARVRSEGIQEAAQAVKAVGVSAEQTTAALRIMAQEMAKSPLGGTPEGWLKSMQNSGVQPTSAALAEAAKQAEKTSAAVATTVTHTKSAAVAAEDLHKGFSLSESSMVRFGAGIVGIGLGLNLAAGAANLIHDAVVGTVNAQLDWERSLVTVHGIYGSIGAQIVAISQAQALAPGLAGTQQEFISANLAASYLTRRYGLSGATVTGLTSSVGAASYALGLDEPARRDLQARALAFAENGGGDSLRAYGIEGSPLSVSRQLGGVSGSQLQALTPAQLKSAGALIASQGLEQFAMFGRDGQPGLLSKQADLQKAQSEAQSRVQDSLEKSGGRGGLLDQIAADIAEGVSNRPLRTEYDDALRKSAADASTALEANAQALGDHTKRLADATTDLAKLGVQAGTATFRLLGFLGNPEDSKSIAYGDMAASAQASVANRARSALPLAMQSPAERNALALDRAFQEAYQNSVAGAAQKALSNSSAIAEGFANRGDTAAMADAVRRYRGYQVSGAANSAGDFASRAGVESDAQLSAISLRSDERRLSVAEQLAGYRTQVLQTEGQMAPLLNQQATLQDRMLVASRDSLTSRRALIEAEKAALPSQAAVQDYDYRDRRVQALAQQRQARLILGQDVSDLPSFDDLINQHVGGVLNRAASGVDIQALDTQHGIDVVQRQRTGEQLGRDLSLTTMESQQRALEDQLIPMTEAARLQQAQQDVISRTLELMDLGDTKERTSAQMRKNAADSLKLVADEIARQAEDYANGMNLGGTAAERSQAALEKSRDALRESVTLLQQLPRGDVDARIANGLGSGGLGPTRVVNVPLSIIVNGASADTVAVVRREVADFEQRLSQALSESDQSGVPASSQLGGARHQ